MFPLKIYCQFFKCIKLFYFLTFLKIVKKRKKQCCLIQSVQLGPLILHDGLIVPVLSRPEPYHNSAAVFNWTNFMRFCQL